MTPTSTLLNSSIINQKKIQASTTHTHAYTRTHIRICILGYTVIMYRLECTSYTIYCTVYKSAVYSVMCPYNVYQNTVHKPELYIVYTVHYTNVQCTFIQYTVCSVHCTLHTVHCTLYTIHCTLHTRCRLINTVIARIHRGHVLFTRSHS